MHTLLKWPVLYNASRAHSKHSWALNSLQLRAALAHLMCTCLVWLQCQIWLACHVKFIIQVWLINPIRKHNKSLTPGTSLFYPHRLEMVIIILYTFYTTFFPVHRNCFIHQPYNASRPIPATVAAPSALRTSGTVLIWSSLRYFT